MNDRKPWMEPGARGSREPAEGAGRCGAWFAGSHVHAVHRAARGLREAFANAELARAVREALRLGALVGTSHDALFGALREPFALVTHESVTRPAWGFDHGGAAIADLCTWMGAGWVPREEALAAAVLCAAEPNRGVPPRAVAMACVSDRDDPTLVAEDLREERRAEAETRVRALVVRRGAVETARLALLPFVAEDLLDYGHGAIFLAKALELAAHFPEDAPEILAAVAVELAWATRETALPVFAQTRAALDAVSTLGAIGTGALAPDARAALEDAVLVGEPAAATAALEALARGIAPAALLRAIGHAAAVRLARFDPAWALREDVDTGWLDVTHAVTFADAALALEPLATPHDAARLVVQAAGFVGRLRRGDRASTAPAVGPAADLASALAARDADAARAWARTLPADGAARAAAFARLAPFALFDAAVLPIYIAHAIKTTESLRRLDAGDPAADGAYLDAALAYLLGATRERNLRRVAALARASESPGGPPSAPY